jgi:2-haloalkanoic acid dehalogenase type II
MIYRAVLFDLLTAVIDSWRLWDDVAGGSEVGRRWRAAYLRRTYGCGDYRAYETLVAEAADEVGLPAARAASLAARWAELRPWPEAPAVLQAIAQRCPIGVVTNCSIARGTQTAQVLGVTLATIVTAEQAGAYKPDPRPYRHAIAALGLAPAQILFVAGSGYDLIGTAAVGLPTVWHNRIGLAPPPGAPAPLACWTSLDPLPAFLAGAS